MPRLRCDLIKKKQTQLILFLFFRVCMFQFRFENQLAIDQDSCIRPDYKSPFRSKEDAVKRLIRYKYFFYRNL